MQLQNIFSLNHQVAVYVPSTRNVDARISSEDHTKRVKEVAETLTGLFGGATSYKAQGYYKSKKGYLVVENVTIVLAFTNDVTLEQKSEQLLNYVKDLAAEWGQESILIEIDGKAFFIE